MNRNKYLLLVWQAEQRRGVPAAGARRGGDVVVAGGAARPRRRARAALAHAARACQQRAQATLLLHAQEKVSQSHNLRLRPVVACRMPSHTVREFSTAYLPSCYTVLVGGRQQSQLNCASFMN